MAILASIKMACVDKHELQILRARRDLDKNSFESKAAVILSSTFLILEHCRARGIITFYLEFQPPILDGFIIWKNNKSNKDEW
jgi:hypothetical protein